MTDIRICQGWNKRKSEDDPKPKHEPCAQKYNERPQVLSGNEAMCPKCARRKKKHDDETFARAAEEKRQSEERRAEIERFAMRILKLDPEIMTKDLSEIVLAIEGVRVPVLSTSTYTSSYWKTPTFEQKLQILRHLAGLPYEEKKNDQRSPWGDPLTREEVAEEKARLEGHDEAHTG